MVAVSIMLAVVTTVLSRTAVVQGPPYLVIDILSGWTGTLLGLGHLIPLVSCCPIMFISEESFYDVVLLNS